MYRRSYPILCHLGKVAWSQREQDSATISARLLSCKTAASHVFILPFPTTVVSGPYCSTQQPPFVIPNPGELSVSGIVRHPRRIGTPSKSGSLVQCQDQEWQMVAAGQNGNAWSPPHHIQNSNLGVPDLSYGLKFGGPCSHLAQFPAHEGWYTTSSKMAIVKKWTCLVHHLDSYRN